MNLIDVIEKESVKENVPEFGIGDTVKVYYKIKEGNKERTLLTLKNNQCKNIYFILTYLLVKAITVGVNLLYYGTLFVIIFFL